MTKFYSLGATLSLAACVSLEGGWSILCLVMATKNLIPITDLFEAHLTVSQLDRAVAFYKDLLGLPLARVFPERKVAFFWIGAPGKAMLGLWEAGTMPMKYQPSCGLPSCAL